MKRFGQWQDQVSKLHEQYELGKPFPHIVLDGFWQQEQADRLYELFPQDIDSKGWIHWQHYNENKHGLNTPALLPDEFRAAFEFLNSPVFISWLEKLTGIPGLLPDPALEGGGLHLSRRGGYLNIHSDFTTHPRQPRLKRRLNAIIYLNKVWQPGWGGDLEFWSADMQRCEARIPPLHNRLVIFNTDKRSFHGFPEPLQCPVNEGRRSMALYYYTEEGEQSIESTRYRVRPGEGWRALPNWVDNTLLYIYTYLKRRLKISDEWASKILRSKK